MNEKWAVPNAAEFLQNDWQKNARLFRQALPDFTPALDANDLAGLACEPDVEARIVLEHGDKPWQLEHGPFKEERFSALPAENWTLLVQDVDKHYPPVAEVLKHFRFIPDWRIDDVMISYAPKGGSVGPHYDLYDVFLLQVEGQRHWKWGKLPEKPVRLDGTDLSILADFNATEEAVLNPGDILYIPPGVGHHGVAENDCVTWSIGFRAPSMAELLSDFSDQLIQELSDSERYSDPAELPPSLQGRHGALSDSTVKGATSLLKARLIDALNDENWATRWFGAMQTSPKVWLQPVAADAASLQRWQQNPLEVERFIGSRWAVNDEQQLLFVAGEIYQLNDETLELGQYLSDQQEYSSEKLVTLVEKDSALELLGQLVASGNLLPAN